jgi:enamine deaminase RidA (YjgF/YER057c/UK114 family)
MMSSTKSWSTTASCISAASWPTIRRSAWRILQILVFITDMKLKPEMNRAWKAFFNNPDHLPARATLGISSIEEGVLIEIVTTAAVG